MDRKRMDGGTVTMERDTGKEADGGGGDDSRETKMGKGVFASKGSRWARLSLTKRPSM